MNNKVFITGGTGYIGSHLIPELIKNNYELTALVRKGSESKLPKEGNIIFGNVLENKTYEKNIPPCDTFIHLVGVAHPGPGKKEQFRSIDMVSIEQAVPAALNAVVKHFIYLSVAHPSPVMKDFVEVRMKGEQLIEQSGMNASFIRPWYVLGPGHYWPYLAFPFYKLFELIPSTKETAQRLGLVKLNQIIKCIIYAVQNPPEGVRIYDVKEIKEY